MASNLDVLSKLSEELGEAIVNLCVDISYYGRPGSGKRRMTHQPGHIENGVVYCGEPHSTDEQVYAWIGNRLANLQDMYIDEFEVIEKLVAYERSRRKKDQLPG
ncbi:MAG: hypothetical protein ACYTF1_22420 [Planctomycetota bacterium]